MSFSISPKSTSLPQIPSSSSPRSTPSAYAYSPYMPSSPKMSPSSSSLWPSSLSMSQSSLLPGPNASPRRAARRVSYTLKNRISRYSLPLGLGLFVTSLFLYMSYSTGLYMPSLSGGLRSRNNPSTYNYNGDGFIREDNNGLSFLDLEEDELIAEDDLFWDAYQEKKSKSKSEQKEMEKMEQRRKEVIKINKGHSLRALIWWIAQGGVLPNGWEVPTKDAVLKMGAGGMEDLLGGIEAGVVGDEIFQDGWADYAKDRYRVVVFSKTFCPYSKNAKKILEQYRLDPAPYIIELDKRTDFSYIQTLLSYLTSRRTVPNILLDFNSIGGSDDITLIHGEGGLQRQFEEMGMLPGWHWKAKHHVQDREQKQKPMQMVGGVGEYEGLAREPEQEVKTPEEVDVVLGRDHMD